MPLKKTSGSFLIFSQSQGASPVSTTPAAKFATGTAGAVDAGGK
jgi:hypothetical protein